MVVVAVVERNRIAEVGRVVAAAGEGVVANTEVVAVAVDSHNQSVEAGGIASPEEPAVAEALAGDS